MKYRVHHFYISMTRDQGKLEQYLNNLEGEVIAIIPNVTPFPATFVKLSAHRRKNRLTRSIQAAFRINRIIENPHRAGSSSALVKNDRQYVKKLSSKFYPEANII